MCDGMRMVSEMVTICSMLGTRGRQPSYHCHVSLMATPCRVGE